MFNCRIVLSSEIPCSQVLTALSICWSEGHHALAALEHAAHLPESVMKRLTHLPGDILRDALFVCLEGLHDGRRLGELVRERNRRVRGALVHRASRRTTAAQPDTKRLVPSKNCVENHILQT